MIEIKKKEGESSASLLFRFTKRVRQSGVLAEARSRRFKDRNVNKRKVRLSAKYRAEKRADMQKKKRLGVL